MPLWTAVALAYVLGSVPFAYLAGRLLKGIDLRTVGSGNLGATNVYRELGVIPALVVLVLDAAKGFVPVWWLPAQAGVAPGSWWAVGFGVAALLGHAKPVFLLWRGGGKGVATAAGVFAALVPVALGLAVLVFTAVVAATRYVSLGSILAAVTLPVFIAFTTALTSPALAVSAAVALFIIWTHRANIGRLRRGEERRLGRAGEGA
jgi:acyl phosphate:glycerol-3-phosphate acyltransferase